MKKTITFMAFCATIFNAAIFGFFYAWICSTMWGLDTTKPDIAITAMQAMNASVRNTTFAPIFFGTPFFLIFAAILAFILKYKNVTWAFGTAGITYLLGGLVLTMSINVPMNEALALVEISSDNSVNAVIWNAYSSQWQVWNIVRALLSGLAMLFSLIGIYQLGQKSKASLA